MNFVEPILGGVLIGLGSLITMAASGKVPGISGVVARVLRAKKGDTAWRIVFIVGLIAGAGAMFFTGTGWQGYTIPAGRSLYIFAIAGLLVGIGTRVGGGCTSGHGVCGIGAGAKDGLIYTFVFMAAGAATVFVWNLIEKGAIAS